MVTQIEMPTAGVPAALVDAAMPMWRQRRRVELAVAHQPPPQVEPLPAPEVRATVVALEDERVPRAARQFAVAAQRAGWSVEITYARGPQRGAREGTFKISDSILVACSRHPPWTGGGREHVRAQWLGGKADECGHTVDGQGVLMTISQGKRLLTSEGVTTDA